MSVICSNCLKECAEGAPTNLIQHLIALVQNERLDVSERKLLIANQRVQATGCADNDIGVCVLVGQELDILLHGSTTVEDSGLDVWEIFAESGVLVLDLVCQFSGVAHNQNRARAGNRLEVM